MSDTHGFIEMFVRVVKSGPSHEIEEYDFPHRVFMAAVNSMSEYFDPPLTIKQAAAKFGVHISSVTAAQRVVRQTPHLIKDVLTGHIGLTAASKTVRSDLSNPQNLLKAQASLRKLSTLMGTFNGFVIGMPELRVDMAIAIATEEEVRHIKYGTRKMLDAVRQLNKTIEEAVMQRTRTNEEVE